MTDSSSVTHGDAETIQDAEAVSREDARADAWAVFIVFWALVAMFVHFASGWTFDWWYDLF